MNTLSKIVTTFCLSSCAFALCLAPCSAQIQWEKDRETAVSTANQTGKYVLYHFSADWCRPCRQLESFVFPNKAVARAIEDNVIPVKVDVDLNPDLVRKYGVTGIPADVITTPSGRVVVQRQSPSSSDGYINMMKQLARVDRNISSGNKALQEKVHELGLTKPLTENLAQKGGDFVPAGPDAKPPALSKESQSLEDNFVNKRFDFDGRLVDTSENSMIFIDATQSEETASANVAQSQTRIINGSDVQQTGSKLDRLFQSNDEKKVVANRFFSADAQITKNDFAAANTGIAQPTNPRTENIATPMMTQANNALSSASNDLEFVPQQVKNKKMEPATQATFAGPKTSQNNAERIEVAEAKIVQERAKTNIANPSFTNEPVAVAEEPAQPVYALRGKCPVTLIQEGRWAEGAQEYGCVHRGKVYLFSDANKLKLFQNHPDDFSPLLAGYDPVKYMEEGKLVDGREQYGVFMGKSPNLRVVLFDTFENRKKFEEDPRLYLSGIRQAEMKATQTRIR